MWLLYQTVVVKKPIPRVKLSVYQTICIWDLQLVSSTGWMGAPLKSEVLRQEELRVELQPLQFEISQKKWLWDLCFVDSLPERRPQARPRTWGHVFQGPFTRLQNDSTSVSDKRLFYTRTHMVSSESGFLRKLSRRSFVLSHSQEIFHVWTLDSRTYTKHPCCNPGLSLDWFNSQSQIYKF